MNSPAKDIIQILVDGGIDINILRRGYETDKPDLLVTVYDTGGEPPNPAWAIDEPTIQVRCRATTYEDAYDKLLEIRELLLGFPKTIVNGTRYVGIWASSDIIALEKDTEKRIPLVINFRMVREPSTSVYREIIT
jgi:hypothetical protein